MPKLLKSLNNVKFRNKMIIIYLACIILPIISVSFFYYSITINKMEKQRMQDTQYSLEIVNKSLQNYFDESFALSNKVYLSKSLYDLLYGEYTEALDYMRVTENINEFINYMPIYDSISAIVIYSDNSKLFRGGALHIIDDSVRNSLWYKSFMQSEQDMLIFPMYDRSEYYNKTISVIRKMDHYKQYKGSLILKIDLRIDRINDMLNSQKLEGVFYLVDDNDRVICTSGVENKKTEEFEKYQDLVRGKEYKFITKDLSIHGWKLVAALDEKHVYRMFDHETNTFISLIFINILFASVVIWQVSKSFLKRLNLLTKCIRKMKEQQFEVIHIEETGNDEAGILIQGMNSAVTKIKQLIEEILETKLKKTEIELEKKRMELNALLGQINPHFMFNILEVVRMKSSMKEEIETARIIKNLSRIFRRAIKCGADIIFIDEEMEFIREYLEIQRYRFDDEMCICIEAEPEAMQCSIPKFTLQVFVENACVHGFEGKDGIKEIKVCVHRSGERVICRIQDNGVGMDGEKVKSILESSDIPVYDDQNVGTKNVIKRLNLYFDQRFDLQIKSGENVGTEVILNIPI